LEVLLLWLKRCAGDEVVWRHQKRHPAAAAVGGGRWRQEKVMLLLQPLMLLLRILMMNPTVAVVQQELVLVVEAIASRHRRMPKESSKTSTGTTGMKLELRVLELVLLLGDHGGHSQRLKAVSVGVGATLQLPRGAADEDLVLGGGVQHPVVA
jgi:hypothetical protein